MMQLVGRQYDNGLPVWIEVHDGVISSLGNWRGVEKGALPWLAPGLVDLQVNGIGGHDFSDWSVNGEAVEQVSLAMDRAGVTSYLPTVVTQSFDLQMHALGTIAAAIDESAAVRQRAKGIHLEGPFVTGEQGPRGAHPVEHCRPPNWDEFQRFQDAARGKIRILTMSPEYLGSPEFIGQVVEAGVIVSIGHSNANSDQIRAAVDAGARMSTHLGNGAHEFLHRHRNYVWDQLAEDRLTATLIVDGHHLSPQVVKSFVRAKMNERVVLISDITCMADMPGLEPGRRVQTALGEVELLDDGRVVMAGQTEYLAGATLPLSAGVANVMRFANIDLAAAIDMASARPAGLLGLSSGRIVKGAQADLIQFDLDQPGTLNIRATVNCGTCVFGEVFT